MYMEISSGIKRIHTMIGLRIRKILFGISLRILQIFMEPHLEIMEILMGISLRIREASMEILLRIRILEVPMEISPRISAGPIRGSKMAGIHTGDSLSLRIMDRSEWQQGIILITACRVEEKQESAHYHNCGCCHCGFCRWRSIFALRSRAKDETIQKVADSSDYSIGNTDVSGSDTEAESVEKDAEESPVTEEEVAVTPEPTATPKPTSTPKPTPTPDAYPASAITASLVSESSVDFSSIHEAYIESASATSEIKQASGVSNDPLLAFDNNTDTNWEEGVDGSGIGESITANFKYENEKVRCIALKLGNWKSGKYYYGNNRPSKLTITLDDLSFQMDFPDSWEEFYVMLNHPFKASSIQVRIDDVHKGTSWDDTCITDIRVLVE